MATASMPPVAAGGGIEGTTSEQPSPLSKDDFIRTATQNYISRDATISCAPNLVTKGKSVIHSGATVRGDYGAPIHIGRYCHLESGVVLMPSIVPASNDPLVAVERMEGDEAPPGEHERALPIIIGSHTRIGTNTRVQSVTIGSCVRVGANCILSTRSKIHDCCIIEDGTVIPPDMVVPPFCRVRGSPGRILGSLPECSGGEFVEMCVQAYLDFVQRLEG
ncbi:hypothetical protein ACHAXT_005498 [Thalassiosira profunda]